MSKFSLILSVLIVFVASGSATNGAYANIAYPDVHHYATNFMNDVCNVLNDKNSSDDAKNKKIHSIVLRNIDFKPMADFCLGRHKKTISEQQYEIYLKIFHQYIINLPMRIMMIYRNVSTDIQSISQIAPDKFCIEVTIINSDDQSNAHIKYFVHRIVHHEFKIYDISTEHYNLLNNTRAMFNNHLTAGGFDELYKFLQDNTQQ